MVLALAGAACFFWVARGTLLGDAGTVRIYYAGYAAGFETFAIGCGFVGGVIVVGAIAF